MAVEVNGSYSYYKNDLEEQMKMRRQERAEEAEKERETAEDINEIPFPKDEYISSRTSGRKTSGLYRLVQDGDGNPKVLFDDPNKPVDTESADKQPVKCTTNTDHVDKEIEKLKEKKKQLEQQISATADEKTRKELEKKLAQVESELSQKDNDTYRRQNAIVE